MAEETTQQIVEQAADLARTAMAITTELHCRAIRGQVSGVYEALQEGSQIRNRCMEVMYAAIDLRNDEEEWGR